MKITWRLVVALAISATIVAGASTYLEMRSERRKLLNDLSNRSATLCEMLQDSVRPALARHDAATIRKLLDKYTKRREGRGGRLSGIAILNPVGAPLFYTKTAKDLLPALAEPIQEALKSETPVSYFLDHGVPRRFIYVFPMESAASPPRLLLVIHDASYVASHVKTIEENNFIHLLLQVFILSLVALWIIRSKFMAPIDQLAEWMKSVRTGAAATARLPDNVPPGANIFEPLASEAARMATSLFAARTAAEEEARLRHQRESLWTPERLKEHVRSILSGRPLFIVANREPYMHVRDGKRVDVISPASGMVTGVEPVMLACGGTWIAHGAGNADKEFSDAKGRLQVPPHDPRYTLKRVWLTPEEEKGYYYGFSNEGLWPLCHIAHTRPSFKSEDWNYYRKANEKFAKALLEEMDSGTEPWVLIQDYHFALLPRLIKEARPDARVAIFWHIPWPNPEAFGICPWQREILDGMLGADLIGFHIQYHCNNFMETVDHALECRVDWERFAVVRRGHSSSVLPFPISVPSPDLAVTSDSGKTKEEILGNLGVSGDLLGVGVDRIDYTKGILERFRGIEDFLEKNPDYLGRFVYVELGAPSRTRIKRYEDLGAEVESEARRINSRFQSPDKKYRPIVLLTSHHTHSEILRYYRAADVCLVTSLHDGMNLVAKEFVAARNDDRGALILSRFTGASRELRDALIVNPYDTVALGQSIKRALEMPPEEQESRMESMRRLVSEQNVYLWAARLIDELAKLRLPSGGARPVSPRLAA